MCTLVKYIENTSVSVILEKRIWKKTRTISQQFFFKNELKKNDGRKILNCDCNYVIQRIVHISFKMLYGFQRLSYLIWTFKDSSKYLIRYS